MQRLEGLFERAIWSSRLLVLVAVIAGILLAIGSFYVTTVDVVHLLGLVLGYADPSTSDAAHDANSVKLVTGMVKAVDGYLLSAILLIFAFGLYELFVGKLEFIEHSPIASRVLLIRSLDDLKDRLAKVVMLVLVIEFFQRALQTHFTTTQDLLYLAISILLVSGGLYLISQTRHQ